MAIRDCVVAEKVESALSGDESVNVNPENVDFKEDSINIIKINHWIKKTDEIELFINRIDEWSDCDNTNYWAALWRAIFYGDGYPLAQSKSELLLKNALKSMRNAHQRCNRNERSCVINSGFLSNSGGRNGGKS